MSDNHHSKTNKTTNLPALLGERYTEDFFERSFYQRDLASVPLFLARLLGNNLPAAVARPRDADEVEAVVRYAVDHRLALTPRAAATTVYWNTVPLRGGIVIDLTSLRGLVELDEGKSTVTVLAGTRWADLEALLEQKGYSLYSYPTSAPAATVGGWVNMLGYGIGSLKYGGLEQLLIRLKVVLPDGQLIVVTQNSQPPLSWFTAAEGTLGIVTEVELPIRRKAESTSRHLLTCANLTLLQNVATELAHHHPIPYYMHLSTKDHMHLLELAGFKPPIKQPILLVSYEGDREEVEIGRIYLQSCIHNFGGYELPSELAEEEWTDRYYSLRMKRVGPTLLGSEFWLPLKRFTDYEAEVKRLAQHQNIPISTYAHIVTPDYATVMSLYPSNESCTVGYLFDLSLTNQLYHIAFRNDGRPYGIGFWNTFYLRHQWSRAELVEHRRRKRMLDPLNLMNPGKLYSSPMFLPPFVFNLGMSVFAWLRRILRISTWTRSIADSKTRA